MSKRFLKPDLKRLTDVGAKGGYDLREFLINEDVLLWLYLLALYPKILCIARRH